MMKFKKLVLMGMVCCMTFASNGMAVAAAEADTELAGEAKEQESAAPGSEADAAAGQDEEIKEQAAETKDASELADEVANLTSVLQSSITSSVSATIENEQAKQPAYTQDDLMYLSCIIYCEAGNQEKKGKIAVANVIMNRVESDIFDHVTTIKEAIYDCERWGRQFSPVYVKSNGAWTTKGSSYEKALTMYRTGEYPKEWQQEQMQECIEAAKEALEGRQVIDSSYLYFNMGITSTKAKCNKTGASYKVIGCHIFY